LWIAAGFAAALSAGAAALAGVGALGAFWDEVFGWGRLYAASTFLEHPVRNGLVRTLNWAGFHAAAVIAAGWFAWRRPDGSAMIRWAGWIILAAAGLSAGMRFFPRYYIILLPPLVLMAARGFGLLGPRREFIALLLLIPATRFGPSYIAALTKPAWRDTAMDRDSRAAAEAVRALAKPGDTLFVWGYRPEIFTYTRLDSQPLTGVPADRHLTQSEPVETEGPAHRRAGLVRSNPSFIVDGLTSFNPRLAITRYPELRPWMAHYREAARTAETVIYRRIGD